MKQEFACSMCEVKLYRFPEAELNDDKNLSVDMKTHDLTHDYHNTWQEAIVA